MSGPALATSRPILKYSVIGLIESGDTRPCLIIRNISITYEHLLRRLMRVIVFALLSADSLMSYRHDVSSAKELQQLRAASY